MDVFRGVPAVGVAGDPHNGAPVAVREDDVDAGTDVSASGDVAGVGSSALVGWG